MRKNISSIVTSQCRKYFHCQKMKRMFMKEIFECKRYENVFHLLPSCCHSQVDKKYYVIQVWSYSNWDKNTCSNTVVLKRVWYFVLLNYSCIFWSNFKTREKFGNCWSWRFQKIIKVKDTWYHSFIFMIIDLLEMKIT